MFKIKLFLVSAVILHLQFGNLNAQLKIISVWLATDDSTSGFMVFNHSQSPLFEVGADRKVQVRGSTSELKCNGQFVVEGTSEFRNYLTLSSGCYTGTWNQCSDLRLKKNVSQISGALNKVLNLKGVSFNWRNDEFPQFNFDNKTALGFVAQDMEKVFPELVRNESNGYKSVSYSNLAPVFVEAIKEQQEIISEQEKIIKKLENKIEQLETSVEDMNEQIKLLKDEVGKLMDK